MSSYQIHLQMKAGIVRIPVVELLDFSEPDDQADDAQHVDDRVGDLGQVLNYILLKKTQS